MSDHKDDLKSIKVYKFDNTKESWHEFALKFRIIADSRRYEDIRPPDEKDNLEILTGDDVVVQKAKRKSWQPEWPTKRDRDFMMSTEGISLDIVENATSNKLSKSQKCQ